MSLNRQLVIFSADSARPSINDLSGLLIGNGQVDRMGGTARISVLVDAAWRVHVLAAEFAERGLTLSWESTSDGRFWVRTYYFAHLVRLDAPSFLDGARLRLWFISTGSVDEEGALLGLGKNHALARPALAPLGLDGEVIRGPAIRITGEAKLSRLAQVMGERPSAAPPSAWPVANASDPPTALRAPIASGRRAVRQDPLLMPEE